MDIERDASTELLEAVQAALASGSGLRITGSGSKAHLTGAARERADVTPSLLLSTLEHAGIVAYRPEELVVTVRAGTPLKLLQQALAENRQQLPFDPPQFGGGTIGGAVACGLSGPGRPWLGSVRDCLLGVEMINGLGERLRFGGQVMKNVAGYDLSRLQAGAFGTLGLLLEVSLKLLPVAPVERTLVLEAGAVEALARCRGLAARAYPVTATCIMDNHLFIRLSGAGAAVEWAAGEIGGKLHQKPGWWQTLRDQEHPFFDDPSGPWRCVVPPAAPPPDSGCLIEWGGALRWHLDEMDTVDVRQLTSTNGGFIQKFDTSYAHQRVAGGNGTERIYHQHLRMAFDPHGLFNPELAVAHAH